MKTTSRNTMMPQNTFRHLSLLVFYDLCSVQIHSSLATRYGNRATATILKGARHKWNDLISQLPDTGGFRNPHTQILISGALFLAFYQELATRGQTVEEIGDLILESVIKAYGSWLGKLMRLLSQIQRRLFGDRAARRLATFSQQRLYPNDFVCVFVEGDGVTFDYGFDYLECGIAKLFHTQKADEFVPYMCRLDFPCAEALGQRLIRTKTIAMGNTKCDFRYKWLDAKP